jgi:hypothetical protein
MNFPGILSVLFLAGFAILMGWIFISTGAEILNFIPPDKGLP